ncbi:hypothetical protein AB6735_23820 [Mucilaginibacter sp. RCC_168]|uniref:hypothetical protein n=1 Tax=Mucilaginibacter sp. RCC_168 TaxID=3239221 RepID=UPI0035263288
MLFLIILILSFASGFFLPWWVVAIAAFSAAFFIGKTSGQAFWSGFLAVFIVWIVLALFKSIPNDHILAKKVAVLLHLPGWGYLLVITGIIGGLVSGFAALSGVLLQKAFGKEEH